MKYSPRIAEKAWDRGLEKEIFEAWQGEGIYRFNPDPSAGPLYSIDTPPPYVNTPIHVGHAYVYSCMDMFARARRMAGYRVLFPMGLDKNGLPIEVQAEKEFGIRVRSTPREAFLDKCKQLLKRYGDLSLESFKRLGLSCNSWDVGYRLGGRYDTDDPEYRRLTQESFIRLWEKGLVYEGVRTTNYCPSCRTAISDAEIDYREKMTDLSYVVFRTVETNEEVMIATTRPELLCACRIILYNPEDSRYQHLVGKHAVVPIYGQRVEIRPHPYARPEYGSGLVMICSYGDYGDVRLLRELKIEPVYSIDEDGRMNEKSGSYKGMKVDEARARIISDLREKGLLVRQEKVEQRQPICERSKDPIEFIAMDEIYLKQIAFRDDLLKMANETDFYAPESRQILKDWIDGLTMDWVLSRRRFYGTEIPLWYCMSCRTAVAPPPGRYYQPWREECPIEACPKCGGREFEGETRIFDTWFDSSTSEVYILGYLWDRDFFERNFPCGLRPQGKEIVRNWLYFTLLKSYHLFGRSPFRDIWIHMHVVDEKGEKMSKSLGNVIDPKDVLDRYGADAFRVWAALEGDISRGDIRCSFPRIEGQAKFLTKLWNIARFISMFPQVERPHSLLPADEWMLAELTRLSRSVQEDYGSYSVYDVASKTRDFVWNLFAAHYVEMVKGRAYGDDFGAEEQAAAQFTLHLCLQTLLKLLAPVIPFITDRVWRTLYSEKSVHVEPFPRLPYSEEFCRDTQRIVEFNSEVWNMKKAKGLSLKESLNLEIPKELERYAKDLGPMHRLLP